MKGLNIIVRPEVEEDYSRITMVHESAFGQPNEGRLVWLLRETPLFVRELSLVAEAETGEIAGHILYYPIFIKGDGSKLHSLALAPLGVAPQYQKKGVGSELIRRGLESARRLGNDSVIVMGDPLYYGRFGFEAARTWNIVPPFKAPSDVFMGMELKEGAFGNRGGVVLYPREFDGV